MLSTVIFASAFDSLSACSWSALGLGLRSHYPPSPLVLGPVDAGLLDAIDSYPTPAVEVYLDPICPLALSMRSSS
ncbi:hypothetical protein C8Q76DRAFT_802037 [Earliella scabrosa]|nr:hypothetical protein C8Q76DRAFT_802037 [Earliella scabrosa]